MSGFKTYALIGMLMAWLGFAPKIGVDDSTVWTIAASVASLAGITLRHGIAKNGGK